VRYPADLSVPGPIMGHEQPRARRRRSARAGTDRGPRV